MNPTQITGKFPSRSFAGSVLCAALLALSGNAFAQSADPAPASDEVVKLSPFTVSTERDYGYRAANSISATRTNTPIKDVPVNIQVFGQEMYEDLLITSQVDLERYNASLINGPGADSGFSTNTVQQQFNGFLFRGFTQNWGLRDGVREYDPIDTQALARVEVIKGPVAALYGVSYPGGVMNNINKSVDYSKNFSRFRGTFRSEGGYRATIDSNVTGTVAGGQFGLRFNGANEKTEDQRAHSQGTLRFMQLVASWKPTPTTELTFLGEQSHRANPNGTNSFAFQRGGTPDGASIPVNILRPNIPWDWNWSNGENFRSLDVRYYKGTINQQVGDNFNLSAYVQYNAHDQIDGNGWDQAGSSGADSWEVAGRGWYTDSAGVDRIESGYSYRDWTNAVHAYGATGVYKMDFTGMKNTFTFGGAAWAEKFLSRLSTSAQTIEHPFAPGSPIVIPFGPPTDLTPQKIGPGNHYNHQNNSNDYYFANLVSSFMDDRLKTNLAVNRTNIRNVAWASGDDTNPVVYDISQNSPMVGAVFAVTKSVNIFAVHSTSLFPTSVADSFAVPLPAVKGKSWEGGVKFETADGKLSGTASYYMIDQTGGAQTDPLKVNIQTVEYDRLTALGDSASLAIRNGRWSTRPIGDQVAGGKAKSTGFELDLNYQPTRNWAIQFSYANNSNKVKTAIDASTIGQSTIGSIKQQFSVLTKYTFSDGVVKGLSIGTGIASAGKSLQNYTLDASTGKVIPRYNPSTLSVDAFATYRFTSFGRKQLLQFNIRNLTEQGVYTGWKPTGSNKLATQRYEVPINRTFEISYGIDL